MSVKPAVLEDVPDLVTVVNESYSNSDGQGQGWTNVNHLVTGLRMNPENPFELLNTIQDGGPTSAILKYEEENEAEGDLTPRILGCVRLEVILKESDNGPVRTCVLELLSVLPKAQGKGVGAKLLKASENWAKSKSCSVIKLTVASTREDLIAYYERKGFVRTGEMEPFPVCNCAANFKIEMAVMKKVLDV